MQRWIAKQRESMRVIPLGFFLRVIVNEKLLNLEKTTSSFLSIFLLIHDIRSLTNNWATFRSKLILERRKTHIWRLFQEKTGKYSHFFLNSINKDINWSKAEFKEFEPRRWTFNNRFSIEHRLKSQNTDYNLNVTNHVWTVSHIWTASRRSFKFLNLASEVITCVLWI